MKFIRESYKYEQLFWGGGIARISALNSDAIIVNIKDYNSVSTKVL